MTILEAMQQRHSVRTYSARPLPDETIAALEREVEAINAESGLHMQLVLNEPKAFGGFMAHYGKFSGVQHYLALIGPKSKTLFEQCGYYGERLVLLAQQLGLNTCWVALSFDRVKSAYILEHGDKLIAVIALGYGCTQGVPHKSKPMETLCENFASSPDWFQRGMQAVLLAPSAINQQKFFFAQKDGVVTATAGKGVYTQTDLGIAKYHFEIGAGKNAFRFA